jgi:23S rRNA (adenine2503-C2)-methyltransferase
MTEQVPIHDRAAIDAVGRELRLDPHQLRQLRTRFFKKFLGAEAALDALPAGVRDELAERIDFHPLRLESRHDSRIDGASKLVWLTRSGGRVESVILRADTGRTTICLSSQVGCAAACDFCATGKMGFGAHLSAGEIVDQVIQAGELLALEGRTLRNIVFMGMGEPFHNEGALYAAFDALFSGLQCNHAPSRVLVSTVGITEGMLRCAERYPAVNQALSLHSPRQEVRESIIPLARKYPLDLLRATVAELNRRQQVPVMLEYLMLEGINDSPDDAAEFVRFAEGLRVHANLIPYNPITAAPHLEGSDRETRDAFATYLKQAGITTTIRYSMGADIEAACGQLVQQVERRGALRGRFS